MKRFIKNNYIIILSVIIGFIIFRLNRFIDPIINIVDNFNAGTFFNRFIIDNISKFNDTVDNTKLLIKDIIIFFKDFSLKMFISNIITLVLDNALKIITLLMNLIIISYIMVDSFINKHIADTKKTKLAKYNISINKTLSNLKDKACRLYRYIKRKKKHIFIGLFIILFMRGILISIIIETGIFLFYYLKSSFEYETYIHVLQIMQTIVILIVKIPIPIMVILVMMILFYIAYNQAINKLEKNYRDLKVMLKYDFGMIVIVNGKVNVGKTRSIVSFSLAYIEIMVEEIESILQDIELSFPDINWSEIEKDQIRHYKEFPDHLYYTMKLHIGKSMIASAPFSIKDPYSNKNSNILDFNYLRPNKFGNKMPLESYKILVISEFDKEYSSHYNKKDVGEDGLHIAFATLSHWLERKGKLFVDYQQQAQLPLNVRGNAESSIYILDSRYKYPFLLSFIKAPFDLLNELVTNIIRSYEKYKRYIIKDSRRKDKAIRKRHDYTFIYSILRYIHYYLNKYVNTWFDKFYYVKYYAEIRDTENNVLNKITYNINTQDEIFKGSKLYDSTFLSKGYEEKAHKVQHGWSETMEEWKSIKPDSEQLKKVNSSYINKSFFNEDQEEENSNNVNNYVKEEINF